MVGRSGLCCGTTGAGPLATTRVRKCFHGANRDVDQAAEGGGGHPSRGVSLKKWWEPENY